MTKRLLLIGSAIVILLLAAPVPPPASDWRSQGILYLDHSINAHLHSVPIQAVHMEDGFWTARRKAVTERSLPTMLALLEEHGAVDNFRRLSGRRSVARKGPVYTDSDVYKWIEAASWAIASNETQEADKLRFRSQIDAITSDILAAQEPSGYLNTFYTGDKVRLRFTDLPRSHEDYCLGHLIQAGVAYYRATGSRTLLDAGIRFSNYIVDNFGPEKHPFVTGHPELEMALVELYRVTGDARYLDFVRYLFSGVERDRLKLKEAEMRYMFSGKPFAAHTEFEGHAVRGLYAASGATDYFSESGEPAFKKTLDLLWTDLTARKMYITGGVGSRAGGESFGDPFELPSAEAYAETCAAVANIMWNYRMLAITGDARYTDVLERTLYNGANSGMSLSGNLYCYRNPLASSGDKLRNPWYDTTCCPPNIERLFESLPGYLFSTSRNGVYVNLFHSAELDWHLEDKTGLKLVEKTGYPWNGDVRIEVRPERPSEFTLYLRWPAWAATAEVQINGQTTSLESSHRGSYIALTRTWALGDSVLLSFPLQNIPVVSNPRVSDTYGKVAIQRGPLIYAAEQLDQGGSSLGDLSIRPLGPSTAEMKKDVLGGVVVLKFPGFIAEKSNVEEPLYASLPASSSRAKRPVSLSLIPYYCVGNREPSPMEVWIPAAPSRTDLTSSSVGGDANGSVLR